MLHEENVPIYGNRWVVYRHVKAIAGSKVESMFNPRREGLLYAIRPKSILYGGPEWLFADKLFD
jgi:hypothetical protein